MRILLKYLKNTITIFSEFKLERAPFALRAPASPLPFSRQTHFPHGPVGQNGGEGGIRTLEPLAELAVFETTALDHYATSPQDAYSVIYSIGLLTYVNKCFTMDGRWAVLAQSLQV